VAALVAAQADVNGTLRVVVTATNDGGSAAATSAETATVAPAAPANTALPTIGGTTQDGNTLSATTGTWSGTAPFSYDYQWRRCDSAGTNCADIAGATASTYLLEPADVGSKIRVVVTATNAADSAAAASAATATVTAAPPVNTTLPTVSGTAEDGNVLTATTGTWTGTPTIGYGYQWRRCDSAGANCADIGGATSSTYLLQPADVDSTLRVVVIATNGGGSASATSSATSDVSPAPPVNTALPTISGTTRDGETLTASNGTWTGTPTLSYGYQWRRCDSAGANCSDIAGATGSTYEAAQADVGAKLRVVVTATNAGGSAAATSAETGSVAPTAPVNTALPTISGTAEDGHTLSASNGTWTGTAPIGYGYQWRRCDSAGANCSDISGATDSTYDLAPGDVDATIRVVVTATNAAGNAAAASAQTSGVTPAAPVNTGLPAISGTAEDGHVLSASNGTWTGTPTIGYAYQWRRCDAAGANCSDVAGATAATYLLQSGDVGDTFRVVVTATNAGGSASATSAETATTAPAAPVNTALPAITGTVEHGHTLSASQGTWTGTPALDFDYQWRRCDSAGAGCSDIAGATGSTYEATQADVGATLRVVVTATNAGGTAAATSDQTATVAATPPVNTGLPTISGTAHDGETLSTSNGSWTGTAPITYGYQWRRCDADGDNCSDIAGATGSTYDVQPADVGSTIRSIVTAINAAGDASATSAQTSAATAIPPANDAPPAISGTAEEGHTLEADEGSWTGTEPITYTYQWRRCDREGADCSDIAGATGATYVVQPGDVTVPATTIRVVVTATNAGGSASATSAQTGSVNAEPPVNVTRPAISGTVRHGQTLTSSNGTWTGALPMGFSYQWRRCNTAGSSCTDISGANSQTYVAGQADVGATLRVRVTAANAGGFATSTSLATTTVAPAAPTSSGLPTISGTTRDGETLSATNGSWDGTAPFTYAYQWRRCDSAGASCSDISGAAASTYDLTPSDIGATVRVVVTATNVAGNQSATSSQSAAIEAIPVANTAAPAISGTAREGETLTAANGGWTGSPTISYAYQWRRCDSAGANCADIAGATASTYEVQNADIGSALRVVVTASNAANSVAATSGATAGAQGNSPAGTGVPSISGTPRHGETLTATNGSWTGSAPISYDHQWRRCDASGASCVNIAGATGSTYELQTADVGSTIRVVVTASNMAGSADALSGQTAVVAAIPPQNTAAPTISGTAEDGHTLSASNGTWTGTPTIAFSYQWRRCDAAGANCADISGATGSTYELTPADVDATIRVVVSGTNAGGDAAAASAQTAAIDPAPPVTTAAPTISGNARDGQTLSAAPGTWSGTPAIDFDYQWRRCDAAGASCVDIAGATDQTYELKPADVGATIRVVVTATNAGGSASATSDQTAAVLGNAPVNTAVPTISGTREDGSTLTATNGTWTGTPTIAFTRQWRRCDSAGANCADIAGATGSTYALGAADVGKTIRVVVTGTNMAGNAAATAAATSAIAAREPESTGPPAVTGTPKEGETLTATPGTWTGTGPLDHGYQWQRCDENGANCVDVPGADDPTYVLGPDDAGKRLRVVVTTAGPGGTTSAPSTPSPKVEPKPAPKPDPKPPVNDGRPTVSGDPAPGSTLTADPGRWSPSPEKLAYQWERCDANGENCRAIDGATGQTYSPTAADDGARLRVTVTASNPDGSRSASSDPTAVVHGAQPPKPDDLGEQIPESLVGPDACTRITAGTGVKRKTVRGLGSVKILLRASAYVAPTNPLRLSTTATGGKLKSVRYTLDGRTVGQPKRKPYWQNIMPSALSVTGGDAHKVGVTLYPAKGRAITYTFDVNTKPCDNLLSTTNWKVAKGAGLRLRVDSRGQLGNVNFRIPAALLPKVRDVNKNVGRLRVFTKNGAKPYSFRMTRENKLVLLQGEGNPRVEIVRGGAVVSNLPEGVGIVELTLYTQKATSPGGLLARGKKARISATTTSAGAAVRLSAVLVGKGR
jgi:hypothetical protein